MRKGSHHSAATKAQLSKRSRGNPLITGRPPSHGHAGSHREGARASPTYEAWAQMKSRCLNEKHENYEDYGGRGITVCQRWMKFENFLADMGERPEGLSLDRKKNDKGYSKGNCRWVDGLIQHNNTRTNRRITIGGRTRTLSEWARESGLARSTVDTRISRGWPEEEWFSPAKWTGARARRNFPSG